MAQTFGFMLYVLGLGLGLGLAICVLDSITGTNDMEWSCMTKFSLARISGEPDISDPGHFGPKTIRTHKIGYVPKCPDTYNLG